VFENDRVRPKSSGSLGKSSGLDALHDQEVKKKLFLLA